MKLVDVIKYEGDNTTFVWKHPCEDFNTMSQLIVHESQEAILFLNGQALDLFGPGSHTLHTKNIPILNKIINLPTGGETPFHCEVFFINKTEQMAINWGMGDVNFLDPTHNNYAFKIGASGEMSLRISDSRKILLKLVGTGLISDDGTAMDQDTIKKYFKSPITTHIKTMLPNILREKCLSIFEVETNLSELSVILKDRISDEMSDYGICLEKFWISTIIKPEKDPFYITLNRQRGERITLVNQGELDIQRADYQAKVGVIGHAGEVQQRKMDIDTMKYEQEQLGFSYQQARGFDVMEKIAQNEGSGSDLRNAAMGIGMGFGVGGAFGEAISNISSSTMMPNLMSPTQASTIPVNSVGDIPEMISLKEADDNQGDKTGLQAQESNTKEDDVAVFKKRLDKLVMMKDANLLSQEEFEHERQLLINSIKGE